MPKCSECGYLMVRDGTSTRTEEADERVRELGQHYTMSGGLPQVPTALCWKKKRRFKKEERYNSDGVLNSLTQTIECDSFTPYWPGRTAREHEEMVILEQIKAENIRSQSIMEERQTAADRRQLLADGRAEKAELRQDAADKRQQLTLWLSTSALFISVIMGIFGPILVEFLKRQIGWSH